MNFLPDYISVGVDVAADFSWFCILVPDGKEFKKPFKVEHDDSDSLKNAVLTIKKAEEQYSMKSRTFLESTGIYHFPLFCQLKELGFEVFVINPLITNSNKNVGIRKVKNDKYDAKSIAAVMHKISDIILAVLRDSKPFVLISPEEHRILYKVSEKAA